MAAGLVIWSVVLWFAWVSQPLTDDVVVVASNEAVAALGDDAGAIATLEGAIARVVPAKCGKVWQSGSSSLAALPALADGEQYSRTPCQRVLRDNQIVLGMNAAVVLVGLLAVLVLFPRRIRTAEEADALVKPDLTAIG